MAVDVGNSYARLAKKKKKKLKPKTPKMWSTPHKIYERWMERYGTPASRRTGGSGGGDGYVKKTHRKPTPGSGWYRESRRPPKPREWWGQEWFGEGREVEVAGLGTVNLREMRHFQNIDPLWRDWLQNLVKQAGAEGWWKDQQQSPLQWMAPVWSAL